MGGERQGDQAKGTSVRGIALAIRELCGIEKCKRVTTQRLPLIVSHRPNQREKHTKRGKHISLSRPRS